VKERVLDDIILSKKGKKAEKRVKMVAKPIRKRGK